MAAQETKQFDAQTDKVFQLMIHSLYERKEIFLRELVSNASDACDKLRYKAISKPELMADDPEFHITITPDPEKKTLTIADNGIGMSRAEMVKNLGTIARSGTQDFMEKLTGDKKKDAQLIGQFGVGFYSAFMVAKKVEVISTAAGKKKATCWVSKGDGKYIIGEYDGEHGRGTTITLHLKDGEEEYLDRFRIKHIVETYSRHIPFTIQMEVKDAENEAETGLETLNDGKAIWSLPKSEVSEEDHQEFFRELSFMPDDSPWMTLHNHVEGMVSYTNLLYIPTRAPFDLFHPDRVCRVKLYVKRVFIAEEGLEVIPSYLRFLRGVVDSEDLPLNISRETVQDSAVLRKIRNSITKKVLGELSKKCTKDREAYAEFWQNFGGVLKEGLCDVSEPRDAIMETCLFRTLHGGEKYLTLKEYVEAMPEGQDQIFYMTGESPESAAQSPQLEGFRAWKIDVLLLTDSVDEFWVNVFNEYEGKMLVPATRSGLDLDAIAKGEGQEDASNKESEESKAENDDFLKFCEETLGDQVKQVRMTSKLKESPACLTVPEGSMDIRMERFMVDNKQIPQASAKILELNPSHPVVSKLTKDFASGQAKEDVADAVHLIFAQANIVEGEPVKDIPGFIRRMNSLMERALAA